MKRIVKLCFAIIAVMAIVVSCTKENAGSGAKDADIVTGTADVTEQAVIVYGYLNLESSVRSNCQFGILYSQESNPTKGNGHFTNSGELDTNNRFEVVLKGLLPYTDYYYKAYVKYKSGTYQYGEVKSFRTKEVNSVEAVDLGLPSGLKWASCNLGATKPEEYGGYYQWGGLQDVTSTSIYLDWNCPYHTGLYDNNGWTKYIPSDKSSYWSGTGNPDNKTVLDPEDDVAHVKLGGKWRMPTREEWSELCNTYNCSWTWTSINGIKGYKVQSKKIGYTDNWIFLPASGYRYFDHLEDVDFSGNYWSSSLFTDPPCCAYFLNFFSDLVYTINNNRFCGNSVRPVSD